MRYVQFRSKSLRLTQLVQQGRGLVGIGACRSASSSSSSSSLSPALSPAVSFLVHQHHLQSVLDQIPASGPKKRLLKGDVLRFLSSGGGGGPLSVGYYSLTVNLGGLLGRMSSPSSASSSSQNVGDELVHAFASAFSAFPSLTGVSQNAQLSFQQWTHSIFGTISSFKTFQKSPKNPATGSWKIVSDLPTRPTVAVLDCTRMDEGVSFPSLLPGQACLVKFGPIFRQTNSSFGNQFEDFFSSHKKATSTKLPQSAIRHESKNRTNSRDDLDQFISQPSHLVIKRGGSNVTEGGNDAGSLFIVEHSVEVDVLVDTSLVPRSVAEGLLKQLKSTIEADHA